MTVGSLCVVIAVEAVLVGGLLFVVVAIQQASLHRADRDEARIVALREQVDNLRHEVTIAYGQVKQYQAALDALRAAKS